MKSLSMIAFVDDLQEPLVASGRDQDSFEAGNRERDHHLVHHLDRELQKDQALSHEVAYLD